MNIERLLKLDVPLCRLKVRDMSTVLVEGNVVVGGKVASQELRGFFPKGNIYHVKNWPYADDQYKVFSFSQCVRSYYALDKIGIIVATDDNGGIGNKGALPWASMQGDLARFKRITNGHAVVMGRRTYESMEGYLPNRSNFVVTHGRTLRRQFVGAPSGEFDTVEFCNKPVSSLQTALLNAGAMGHKEAWIIGGVGLFTLALEFADVVELTTVHTPHEADTFLPRKFFEDLENNFVQASTELPGVLTHSYGTWIRK